MAVVCSRVDDTMRCYGYGGSAGDHLCWQTEWCSCAGSRGSAKDIGTPQPEYTESVAVASITFRLQLSVWLCKLVLAAGECWTQTHMSAFGHRINTCGNCGDDEWSLYYLHSSYVHVVQCREANGTFLHRLHHPHRIAFASLICRLHRMPWVWCCTMFLLFCGRCRCRHDMHHINKIVSLARVYLASAICWESDYVCERRFCVSFSSFFGKWKCWLWRECVMCVTWFVCLHIPSKRARGIHWHEYIRGRAVVASSMNFIISFRPIVAPHDVAAMRTHQRLHTLHTHTIWPFLLALLSLSTHVIIK